MEWTKIDHFTGEPYKKNPKSGAWNIVDYVCGNIKIINTGRSWSVTKDGKQSSCFFTLKQAKKFAETLI